MPKLTTSSFLDAYELIKPYLLKPDRSKGRAGIYAGYSPARDPVLVKVWRRAHGANDEDLEEIWHHELRQLHRLAGYPGAADCITHLYDAGYDRRAFYLVLATGQRRPLHALLESASPGHWLKQPRVPGNRARIWRNLALLARGLETLHSQGLLHRNLDTWAVLTAGTEEPDFQLTGFEWSMRIVGAETKRRTWVAREGRVHDSFLRDWMMYGLLAADLLGAKKDALLDLAVPPHEVAEHLNAEEALLLRSLTLVQPEIMLSGEMLAGRIDRIVRALAAESVHRSPKLHVAFRLGRDTPLGDHIRHASDNEIESDDSEAQLAFVKDDLTEAPMLFAVRRDGGDGLRLFLRGRNLSYRLQEFRPPRSDDTTWEFAYCDGVEKIAPAPVNVIGQTLIELSSLELMALPAALESFPRQRGKLRSWNDLRQEFLAEAAPPTPQQITHKALSLIQFLEALYAAANVFPVEVCSIPSEDADGLEAYTLKVRSRPEPERDNLSRALGLKPPAMRLEQELTGERVRPEGWILSDRKSLGEKSPADTEWRFRDVEAVQGKPDSYVFTGAHPAPMLHEAFLNPEGSVGQDVQFRRRLKALRALADHDELLRMMTDPRHHVMESHDLFTEDEAYAKLDVPKQEALRQLISTLPLYLVQGPPGVGKTRLVRDLVRRRFSDEPTSRLLLTAQSNAAVDHLMDELEAILDKNAPSAPLIVRCRGKDSALPPSRFDIRLQSRQLIGQMARSELSASLPEKLRSALSYLATWASTPEESDSYEGDSQIETVLGRSVPHALRAFEGAVARAANVVFATTNSGELERLIDERAQCDWTIVEEAGKATGSELVSPLLLSHRRLMIGDHKQLPPFGSDQMIELLKSPEAVQNALSVGEEFVGRSLRDTTTEEILDEVEDERKLDSAAFPRLCSEALRVLTFFENAIEAEFRRQSRRQSGRPIAKKLTQQHRMHPVIASLVSRCFYNNELATHVDCICKYETEARPFTSLDPTRLPLTPIVVIDMPYVQATINMRGGDCYPRWHNPEEVEAVVQCLALLTPSATASKRPSLAVLSPYAQQVRRLAEAMRESPNATAFAPPSHSGLICHTVDSFQGSEADVVFISLVRNNEHSNIRSAFGFLSDIRRMNVLLSRARWQLILVASLRFMREVLGAVKGSEGAERVSFMQEMLDELSAGHNRGFVSIVPYSRLTGRTQ